MMELGQTVRKKGAWHNAPPPKYASFTKCYTSTKNVSFVSLQLTSYKAKIHDNPKFGCSLRSQKATV